MRPSTIARVRSYSQQASEMRTVRPIIAQRRAPFDAAALEVRDGLPEEDGGPADPPEERAVFAPGYHPGELKEIAERLLARA
jgi:hypothetical protein